MKKPYVILLVLTALVLFGCVLLGLSSWWYSHNLQPVNSSDTTKQLIRVEDGESSAKVAQSLKGKGVIRNPWAFRLYLRIHGISGQLQAGLYQLTPNQSAPDIARILASGQTAVRGITITGGMSLTQITDKLKQLGYQEADIQAALSANYNYSVLKDKPAGASLEGYLLPETYLTEVDTPVSQLIELILKTTDEQITPEIRQAWADHGLNIHQGLTLSSIVQKEASKPDDQRKVAQVFYKRLAEGRKLESDVTFIYGAKLLGVEPTTGVDSPYNTYLHQGLPPGPIGAVELPAMEAAGHPTDTNYLFFIADKEGNMHFAEDADKHKQNIEKYLN